MSYNLHRESLQQPFQGSIISILEMRKLRLRELVNIPGTSSVLTWEAPKHIPFLQGSAFQEHKMWALHSFCML